MDEKLQKRILEVMKNKNGEWPWTLDGLEGLLKEPRSKIKRNIHLLESENKIERVGNIYEIRQAGYELFAPWYKKTWKFFTNDIAKILSIIAIILSIISIVWNLFRG